MSPAGRDQQFCCAQRVAGDTDFEESVVFGARARRNRGLPLAWSPAYLDEPALTIDQSLLPAATTSMANPASARIH